MEEAKDRREFSNMEEAFNSLPEYEQEHSIRTAYYAESLFLQVCAVDFSEDNPGTAAILKPELASLVGRAAKYIHVGNALVPELYHNLRKDFSDEEIALYQKHPINGAELAGKLLEKEDSLSSEEIKLITDMILYHQECWDGSGFPYGKAGTAIPLLGRIAAIAGTLDDIAVNKHSETPFEYAIQQLIEGAGTRFDPQLIELLTDAKPKLKRIFNRFIDKTRTIPNVEMFVKRYSKRPFTLWYRPVVETRTKKTAAVEAVMRFRKGKGWQEYSEVEHIIKKERLLKDLGIYAVTEACDTLRRLDAGEIAAGCMIFPVFPGWLNNKGIYKGVLDALKDTELDAGRLCFKFPAAEFGELGKTALENVQKLSEAGCKIMAGGCRDTELDPQKLKAAGVNYISITSDMGHQLHDDTAMKKLWSYADAGITIMADGIVKKSHTALFQKNKISLSAGMLSGDYMPEDDFVESELAALEI